MKSQTLTLRRICRGRGERLSSHHYAMHRYPIVALRATTGGVPNSSHHRRWLPGRSCPHWASCSPGQSMNHRRPCTQGDSLEPPNSCSRDREAYSRQSRWSLLGCNCYVWNRCSPKSGTAPVDRCRHQTLDWHQDSSSTRSDPYSQRQQLCTSSAVWPGNCS